MYQIVAGLCVTDVKGKNGVYSQSLATFPAMKVGDSFCVPTSARKRLSQAAIVYKRRNEGWNYAIRTSDNEARVWRTA